MGIDKEKIVRKINIAALISVISNMIIAYLSLKSCTARFWSDDDWGIANYLSGARGEEYATPYIKFINICLAGPLYVLHKIYHDINWFAVAETMVVFFAFSSITYVMIVKMRKYSKSYLFSYIIPILLILTFASSFYVRIQFSQTASIGCAAGSTLIMYSFYATGEKINLEKIFGTLLVLFSSLFRSFCFPLIMPFVLYMMLVYLKKLYSGKLEIAKLKKLKNFFCLWTFIAVSWIATIKIQEVCYYKGYEEYDKFNSARANLLDYQIYPYEEIAEDLQKIGVSANDYALITGWTLEDPTYITADLLTKIKALQPDPDYGGKIRIFFSEYKTIMISPLFIFLLLLSGICLIADFKNTRLGILYLVMMIHLIAFYFTIVGRYPGYIAIGPVFAGICLIIFLADFSKILLIGYKKLIASSVCTFFVLFPFGNNVYIKNINSFQFESDGVEMYDYINRRSDDIFIIPTYSSGGLPNLRNSYSVFRATKAGTYANIVGLGGWSTGNPEVVEFYHKLGIYSALLQITDKNVYLLSNEDAIRMLMLYIKEHDGKESSYSLTNIQYGTTIYKVTGQLEISSTQKFDMEEVKVSYEEEFNMYKLSSMLSIENSLEGKELDLYYSVYDTVNGVTKYYMLYDSSKVTLGKDKKEVFALLPADDLISGHSYSVNIVAADAEGTVYGNSDEGNILNLQ